MNAPQIGNYKNMDVQMANTIIDESNITTSIMNPADVMQLLGLIAYDEDRLKKLASIIENTLLLCDVILLPGNDNPFTGDEQKLAADVIDKHREILDGLKTTLNV